MKENILITALIILIAALLIQTFDNNNDRYTIKRGNNNITILIDKKTGLTWRNCICSDKNPIPGCWEKMNIINPEPYNQPTGNAKLTKKLMKKQILEK